MRILITTDVIGGVWNFTLSLVRGLEASGHDCLVAMLGRPSDEQRSALPAGVECAERDLRLEWMPHADRDVAAGGTWLRELVDRWQPDLVHLNQFAYASVPFGVPTVVVAHSDVRSWWGEVHGREAPPEWETYTGWVRHGLAGATAVVAPTAYQSGLLARHYGRAAHTVIHNGIDLGSATPLPPTSSRSAMMSAGRAWDAAKAMHVLDEALALLGDDAPVTELAGALHGPNGESYSPVLLRPLGKVTRPEMDRLYTNARIYIATSVYEPFGLAPLEAALHGCALVLSDIGSFRDLWSGCAEFHSVGNPASLAGALRRVLDDPARTDRLGRDARERAISRYTAERMCGRYQDLYASPGAAGSADEDTYTPALQAS